MEIPADFSDEDLQPREAAAALPDTVKDLMAEPPAMRDKAEQSPEVKWHKDFDFPGALACVSECREQVMEFVGLHCPNEDDRIDLRVAIQEALANAALHGCHDDPAKRIHCRVTANANEITVAVRDPGPGFDLQPTDADKCAATKLSHGRGICLMRSLMTEVSFAHGGAEIVLHKQIRATA